jgi:hypothetical protein
LPRFWGRTPFDTEGQDLPHKGRKRGAAAARTPVKPTLWSTPGRTVTFRSADLYFLDNKRDPLSNLLSLKTGIYLDQPHKAAYQQPGASKQQYGECCSAAMNTCCSRARPES